MDLVDVVKRLDGPTARAFVEPARNVVAALLIEAEQVQAQQTPPPHDYRSAELSRESPAGGWLAPSELRRMAQELAEAVAAERWVDGFVTAVRVLSGLGVR